MLPRAFFLVLLLASPQAQDRADLKRARAALRKGDHASAEKMFSRLAESRPSSWEAHSGWWSSLMERGRAGEAQAVCDRYLKTAPGHAGARIARARADLELGHPERALEALRPLLDDVRARSLAAEALDRLDRVEEAAALSEPLVGLYSSRHDEWMKEDLLSAARGLVVHARCAGKSEVYKQVAQLILPDVLRADPSDAAVHAFLGRCLLDKYNDKGAAQSFEEALEANPACVPALTGQARLHLQSGRAAAALDLCEGALRINPACEEAHLLRAEARLLESEPAAARAELDRGLEKLPGSHRLRALRAAALHLLEDPAAPEALRLAEEAAPSSPRPAWETARVLLSGGRRRFDEAQVFFKKALERNGAVAELLIDYGMNCLRTGDEETGRKLLEEAHRKDPFHVRLTNTVNLLQEFERSFELLTPPHFRVRVARSERRWIEAPLLSELGRAWTELSRRYGFEPREPLLVEIFPRHSDFSVRTAGVPGLGALGACFGRVVTSLSPRARDAADLPPYRWSVVLRHELAHAFALELSRYRVPSWFTEGLATYEEELAFPGGRREADLRLLEARRKGQLRGVAGLEAGHPSPDPVLTTYLQGARICAFIAARHGFEAHPKLLRAWGDGRKTAEVFRQVLGKSVEEFDREFLAWLDQDLARIRMRAPAGDAARLHAEAAANPKDAVLAARLAHALLAAGREKDAETFARRALESDPASAEAHAALGLALLRRRERDDAIPHLQKGTDDYQNWDALGRALADAERWTDAAAAFRKALACYPGYHEDSAWRRLNDALLAARDTEGAFRALEGLVAADPLDYRNRLKLARLYDERGDGERMAAVLDEAAAIEVRDLALLDLQAAAARRLKDYARATDRSLAALALLEAPGAADDPAGKADRYCAVGEDCLARGMKEKAREYAQEALRLVSGLERARKLYEAAKP